MENVNDISMESRGNWQIKANGTNFKTFQLANGTTFKTFQFLKKWLIYTYEAYENEVATRLL